MDTEREKGQADKTESGFILRKYFITWVKEDNGLKCCIFVVIYLDILEWLDQFVQHSVGYSGDLWLRAIPVDHAAITCRHRECQSMVVLKGIDPLSVCVVGRE